MRQIICLSKMHEKHRQKTHMLSEVADQPPANSIKKFSPTTGTSPIPHQSKSLTQPPHKPALREGRVNTKQVDISTLTLNHP